MWGVWVLGTYCVVSPLWHTSVSEIKQCFILIVLFNAHICEFSQTANVFLNIETKHIHLQTYTWMHHYHLPFQLLSVVLSCRLKDLFPLRRHSWTPISVTRPGTGLPRSKHKICGSKMFCHSFISQTSAVGWGVLSWVPGGIKNVFNPNGRAQEACRQSNYTRWRQLSPSKVFTPILKMSTDVIMAENQVSPESDVPRWEEICSHKITALG